MGAGIGEVLCGGGGRGFAGDGGADHADHANLPFGVDVENRLRQGLFRLIPAAGNRSLGRVRRTGLVFIVHVL